jgi:hypothetical protein
MTLLEQMLKTAELIKERFPNLTVREVNDLAAKIVLAIEDKKE